MKLKVIASVIIVSLMLSAVLNYATVGCAGVERASPLVEIIELVPDDVTKFCCFDIDSWRVDADLEDLYDDFRSEIGAEKMEEVIGISLLDVNLIARAFIDGASWLIIKGRFDLDDVRDALEDRGWEQDEYRRVEVWYNPRGHKDVAFLEDMVIIGEPRNVKASIRLSQGKGTSMYGNEDVNSVVRKLRGGIITEILSKEEAGPALALGISINKLDEETLKVTGWFKFENERTAESKLRALQTNLERELNALYIDCYQRDEFIRVIGEVDISDFRESRYWFK